MDEWMEEGRKEGRKEGRNSGVRLLDANYDGKLRSS